MAEGSLFSKVTRDVGAMTPVGPIAPVPLAKADKFDVSNVFRGVQLVQSGQQIKQKDIQLEQQLMQIGNDQRKLDIAEAQANSQMMDEILNRQNAIFNNNLVADRRSGASTGDASTGGVSYELFPELATGISEARSGVMAEMQKLQEEYNRGPRDNAATQQLKADMFRLESGFKSNIASMDGYQSAIEAQTTYNAVRSEISKITSNNPNMHVNYAKLEEYKAKMQQVGLGNAPFETLALSGADAFLFNSTEGSKALDTIVQQSVAVSLDENGAVIDRDEDEVKDEIYQAVKADRNIGGMVDAIYNAQGIDEETGAPEFTREEIFREYLGSKVDSAVNKARVDALKTRSTKRNGSTAPGRYDNISSGATRDKLTLMDNALARDHGIHPDQLDADQKLEIAKADGKWTYDEAANTITIPADEDADVPDTVIKLKPLQKPLTEAEATAALIDESANANIVPGRFTAAMSNESGREGYNAVYDDDGVVGPKDADGNDLLVSEMTLDQLVTYTDPNGEYGASVAAATNGPVSTPVGMYQIIGTKLREVIDDMGLDGEAVFTPELQDKMAMHAAKTRLDRIGDKKENESEVEYLKRKRDGMRQEWLGLGKVPDTELDKIISDLEGNVAVINQRDEQIAQVKPEGEVARELELKAAVSSDDRAVLEVLNGSADLTNPDTEETMDRYVDEVLNTDDVVPDGTVVDFGDDVFEVRRRDSRSRVDVQSKTEMTVGEIRTEIDQTSKKIDEYTEEMVDAEINGDMDGMNKVKEVVDALRERNTKMKQYLAASPEVASAYSSSKVPEVYMEQAISTYASDKLAESSEPGTFVELAPNVVLSRMESDPNKYIVDFGGRTPGRASRSRKDKDNRRVVTKDELLDILADPKYASNVNSHNGGDNSAYSRYKNELESAKSAAVKERNSVEIVAAKVQDKYDGYWRNGSVAATGNQTSAVAGSAQTTSDGAIQLAPELEAGSAANQAPTTGANVNSTAPPVPVGPTVPIRDSLVNYSSPSAAVISDPAWYNEDENLVTVDRDSFPTKKTKFREPIVKPLAVALLGFLGDTKEAQKASGLRITDTNDYGKDAKGNQLYKDKAETIPLQHSDRRQRVQRASVDVNFIGTAATPEKIADAIGKGAANGLILEYEVPTAAAKKKIMAKLTANGITLPSENSIRVVSAITAPHFSVYLK